MSDAVPMVLKSRADLSAERLEGGALPITPAGTTYTMAQEATWIDDAHYAVGRWDGSLSIFKFTSAPSVGPMIAKAVNAPAQEGIQMITALDGSSTFATSNDERSVLVWCSANGTWTDLGVAATLSFDPGFGVANSGATAMIASRLFLAVGHANGWLSIWGGGPTIADWDFVTAVDVRASKPVNPWGLANVRGVAALPSDADFGYVVTGAEDGNLTLVRLPDGKILDAIVYNSNAQRGINSLAINGSTLLVANCAVGPNDFNLWSYEITPGTWRIAAVDRANLRVDSTASQVFNFDVVWAGAGGQPSAFFCSTEEGVLWMGSASLDGKMTLVGYQSISGGSLGSAICCRLGQLTATAHDLHEFILD